MHGGNVNLLLASAAKLAGAILDAPSQLPLSINAGAPQPDGGRAAISELDSLLERLERAIAAIERRRLGEQAMIGELRQQQGADRARLARIEAAAGEAVAAIDALLAGPH